MDGWMCGCVAVRLTLHCLSAPDGVEGPLQVCQVAVAVRAIFADLHPTDGGELSALPEGSREGAPLVVRALAVSLDALGGQCLELGRCLHDVSEVREVTAAAYVTDSQVDKARKRPVTVPGHKQHKRTGADSIRQIRRQACHIGFIHLKSLIHASDVTCSVVTLSKATGIEDAPDVARDVDVLEGCPGGTEAPRRDRQEARTAVRP